MLNDLNNYRVLYIPFGGLAGCWLYHGLYNKFQSIFKLNILDYNFYMEEYDTIPENTNFGIKVNVIKNLLDSHNINYLTSTQEVSRQIDLIELLNDGTVYIDCQASKDQIQKLNKNNKEMRSVKEIL